MTDPDILVERIPEARHSLMLGIVNGKEIIRIGLDGKVTLGEGVEVDEAAQRFWDAVEQKAMAAARICPHCGKWGA